MPIYEYECPSCHKRFDLRQGFNDPAEASCPACGADAKRRLQVPGIVFKGRGWYATDNRPSSFGMGYNDDKPSSTESDDKVPASTSSADEP